MCLEGKALRCKCTGFIATFTVICKGAYLDMTHYLPYERSTQRHLPQEPAYPQDNSTSAIVRLGLQLRGERRRHAFYVLKTL